MEEIWKPIQGYEGLYEVSNFGSIKSLQRRVGGRRETITVIRDLIMSPYKNPNGYMMVCLTKDGKRKSCYIHRLVAEAFCDKNGKGDHINHKDHDRANNNAANLEWVTAKENIAYSAHLMKHPKAVCRISETGEKYITKCVSHGKQRFRVNISWLGIDRKFRDLQSAVNFRNEVMRT